MKSFRAIISLFVLMTGLYYASAQPGWSRGEQLLYITFEEGMNRAEAGLKAEGFVNLQRQANFVAGYKFDNTAIIMVNEAPGGKQWINIVVMNGGGQADAAGAERVKLQQRMEQPFVPTATAPPTTTTTSPTTTSGATNSTGCPLTSNYGLTVTPSAAYPGETVKVKFNYPGANPGSGDWVGFFYADSKTGYLGFWSYVYSIKNCEYDFVVPRDVKPGPFHFRYILEAGYDKVMAQANFTILSPGTQTTGSTGVTINPADCNNSGGRYALTVTPASAKPGQTVKVRFLYPGTAPGSGDWIGLFYPETKTSYTGPWAYTTALKNCEYDYIVPNISPGKMQFRYILEAGYDKVMATADFMVLPN